MPPSVADITLGNCRVKGHLETAPSGAKTMVKPRRTKEQRLKDAEFIRLFREIKFTSLTEQVRLARVFWERDTLGRSTMTALLEPALGQIGWDARDTVPALIELLGDQKVEMRWASADALGSCGLDAVEAVPGLVRLLDGSFVRRWECEEPALLTAVDDPGQHRVNHEIEACNCRCSAARALGDIGAAAKDSAPSLIRASRDEDWNVRGEAIWALGQFGPVTDDVIPTLIEALRDPRDEVFDVALNALGWVGIEAPMATLPKLLEAALTDDNSDVQGNAFLLLGRLGSPAIPALIDALNHPSRNIRRLAAEEFATRGKLAGEAVPALTKALKDHDARVRKFAAHALEEVNAAEAPTR